MAGMRKLVIAGNWKMYKVPTETERFVRDLAMDLGGQELPLDVIVAPPFVSLPSAVSAAKGTPIRVGAQNLYWEDQGAYTGEVSGPMLVDLGCAYVIIGHSERRQYFGETDETVNKRIGAALRNGLIPIFCLGETLGEREGGRTFDVVRRQLETGLRGLPGFHPEKFLIAYEPVWAIGTGRTATPEQAQEVHAFLRAQLGNLFDQEFAGRIRILYGGSVKPENTGGLVACEDIDGGLVGGASLKIADFKGIIRAAL
jgi:triosephosphate isomerase (TIM)